MSKAAGFFRYQFLLAFVLCSPIFFSIGRSDFDSRVIKISEVNNYTTDDERNIFDTFDAEAQNDQGSPIDPFDLINRLKQAGAMNDATTPSDALDEALNAFDQSEYENIPIK